MSVFSHAKSTSGGHAAGVGAGVSGGGGATGATHGQRTRGALVAGAKRCLPGEVPAVAYPDASSLERPTQHRGAHLIPIIMCALLAAGVAGYVVWRAFDAVVVEPERELQRTIDRLEAKVDYALPTLASLVDLADAEMDAALRASGTSIVVLEPYAENPEDSEGFDLYRLPANLTEKQGAAFLETGVSSLKRSQAALLLNGAWRYTVYRYLSCAVRLQYADFTATTPFAALAHAMQSQGWLTQEALDALVAAFASGDGAGAEGAGAEGVTEAPVVPRGDGGEGAAEGDGGDEGEGEGGETAEASVGDAETATDPTISKWTLTPLEELGEAGGEGFATQEFDGEIIMGESGVDTNGNTFQAGTLIIGERHYEFRISTVTVEEMYGLDLPRDGMFVGIRLTQIILE